MTKDEELKEAREWLSFITSLLIAYHHHRLDTDRDKFKQTDFVNVEREDGETDTLTAEEAIRRDAKIRERQIPQNSKGTK